MAQRGTFIARFSYGLSGLFALISITVGARAAPVMLFSADFQDNSFGGWQQGGQGDVHVTNYKGNYSLRLTDHAEAVATMQTRGAANISIEASFAAYQLTPHDKCVAEYSIDDGASWDAVDTVRQAQADGLTLHSGEVHSITPPSADVLLVRLRAQLSLHDGQCWGDNIVVRGEGPR